MIFNKEEPFGIHPLNCGFGYFSSLVGGSRSNEQKYLFNYRFCCTFSWYKNADLERNHYTTCTNIYTGKL